MDSSTESGVKTTIHGMRANAGLASPAAPSSRRESIRRNRSQGTDATPHALPYAGETACA